MYSYFNIKVATVPFEGNGIDEWNSMESGRRFRSRNDCKSQHVCQLNNNILYYIRMMKSNIGTKNNEHFYKKNHLKSFRSNNPMHNDR